MHDTDETSMYASAGAQFPTLNLVEGCTRLS
jgi:hypothetical protein